MSELNDMFESQAKLQHQLGYRLGEMSMAERTAYIKEYSLHMTDELHEMLRELPYFKPWKNPAPRADEESLERAREEFVDVIHFLLNIGLALGFNAERLYMAYSEKLTENIVRQTMEAYKVCVDEENADGA